jgi:hypothetical protein
MVGLRFCFKLHIPIASIIAALAALTPAIESSKTMQSQQGTPSFLNN